MINVHTKQGQKRKINSKTMCVMSVCVPCLFVCVPECVCVVRGRCVVLGCCARGG